MSSHCVYIENEGALFRGFGRSHPTEVYSHREGGWRPYKGSRPKPIEWGYEISEAEAHRMIEEEAKRLAAAGLGDFTPKRE